ncbi:hypothetical protein DdX_14455 [Ditylenchus destructor]|uniref:Uncharacterized protein n=1 Tax=Ditylenchus destructor TaxID=166010 RepID=A0AAD4MRS0_9BILA|nr:hypothetical protein DdX_14455 [Ditylenchus destructor]
MAELKAIERRFNAAGYIQNATVSGNLWPNPWNRATLIPSFISILQPIRLFCFRIDKTEEILINATPPKMEFNFLAVLMLIHSKFQCRNVQSRIRSHANR